MDTSIFSSSPLHKHVPGDMWRTPEHAKVHGMCAQGTSYSEIRKKTGLMCSTIQGIVKGPSSRTTRKGKQFKPKLIKQSDIKRVIRWVSVSWDNRRASYVHIKAVCCINASTTTLCKTLKAYGYRRCVACRRPFISKKQAKKHLEFAEKYRWWRTKEWRHVL
jgi:hypothetical protein